LHEDLELVDLISLNITHDNNELVFTSFVKESVRTGCCCKRTEKRFLNSIVLLYEEIAYAERFRRILLWELNKGVMVNGTIINEKVPEQDPPKRKVLVLINPFGGAGAAARNFETARPLLEAAYIEITVKWTERA
jgi:hypothetical protein